MDYFNALELSAAGGTVLVSPSEVLFVRETLTGSELELLSGTCIPVNKGAEEVALSIWEFPSKASNTYYSDENVIAVEPNEDGSRVHFRGGKSFSVLLPIDVQIRTLRVMQEHRAKLKMEKGA